MIESAIPKNHNFLFYSIYTGWFFFGGGVNVSVVMSLSSMYSAICMFPL